MIDAYFIGYSRSASSTIELALHAHPQIQQSYKMRIFVRDTIYPQKLNEALSIYQNDDRVKIESDEELIGNDLMGDYRLALERAKQHNPHLKVIVSIRSQKTHIPSEFINDLISNVGFLTLKNWINTPRGCTVIKSNYYYERIKNIYDLFGKENVHVIIFEKLVQNPLSEFNKMFDFLDVERMDESLSSNKNNPSPSPISILMMSYFNKTFNALRCVRNFRRPILLPQFEQDSAIDIYSLTKCIDSEQAIFKPYFHNRTHKKAVKFLYIPVLQKIEPTLKKTSKWFHLSYVSRNDKEVIANTYRNNNRKLEDLLGIDLSPYGY